MARRAVVLGLDAFAGRAAEEKGTYDAERRRLQCGRWLPPCELLAIRDVLDWILRRAALSRESGLQWNPLRFGKGTVDPMTQSRFSPGRRRAADFARSSRPAFSWEEADRSPFTVEIARHGSCSGEEAERVTAIAPIVSNNIGAGPIREPFHFALCGANFAADKFAIRLPSSRILRVQSIRFGDQKLVAAISHSSSTAIS
jgi:hypothetical protein